MNWNEGQVKLCDAIGKTITKVLMYNDDVGILFADGTYAHLVVNHIPYDSSSTYITDDDLVYYFYPNMKVSLGLVSEEEYQKSLDAFREERQSKAKEANRALYEKLKKQFEGDAK